MMISSLIDRAFDEEGAEIIKYALFYIGSWLVIFLALNYLSDHLTLFKGKIYDFPIDPAREPLPKEEVS